VTETHARAPEETTETPLLRVNASPRRTGAARVLELDSRPESRRAWLAEFWAHREVLDMLARKDFQVRYKRASFGVVWAVAVPLVQAGIMAVVFSRVIRIGAGPNFAVFVMGGVIAFSYFNSVIFAGATSIVEAATLTDKVWFPRALLVVVPALSNLVGLAVTLAVLLGVMPLFGVPMGAQLLIFIPATVLLIALSIGFSLVLSALYVYFRDVKFIVQAALLVWIYVTPILYPQHLLRSIGPWLDANPLTGVVIMFHMATVGSEGPWIRPVVISVAATIVLLLVGIEAQRKHDRLFVDKL
jgi:lipopolysaccharide transport system permease protein